MKFDLVYADPPWPYSGSNSAYNQVGAEDHYALMSWDDINAMPVRDICTDSAACLLWCTGPFLDQQILTLKEWGFHYRGVAFVWVKTNQDGSITGAKGGPPTFVKSLSEFLILGTTKKKGRPFPIHDFTVRQVHLAQRLEHSEKPESIRQEIDKLVGDVSKIELFARKKTKQAGWHQSGLEFNDLDYTLGDLVGEQNVQSNYVAGNRS